MKDSKSEGDVKITGINVEGNDKSIKEKIIVWAAEEDFEAKIEATPKEAPIDWALRITSKAPITVNIIVQKPRGKESQLIASLGVVVSEQHYNGLMGLKEKDRWEVVYSIIRDLTTICPDCYVIVQPSPVNPQRLLITKILYTDTLTKEKFLSTLRVLVNMFALLSLRLSALFGAHAGRRAKDTMGFM